METGKQPEQQTPESLHFYPQRQSQNDPTQNAAHDVAPSSHQAPTHLEFRDTGDTTVSSMNFLQFSVFQPPCCTSASLESSVALEKAQQLTNLYALPTSVEPIERARGISGGATDASDVFDCHHHLIAGDGCNTSSLMQHMNSQIQFLLDPLAWLPKSEPSPSTTIPNMSSPMTEPTGFTFQPGGTQASTITTNHNQKPSSNLKLPPIRAAEPAIPGPATKHQRQAETYSSQESPYEFLKSMLKERGYMFTTIKSLEVGYMTKPSPLQLASFGTKLIEAVQTSDVTLLSLLLGCGLSPNPCNQFRDYVLGWVCRNAKDSVFLCFLEHHAEMKLSDAFGRTPLHHAAWADPFSPIIVTEILRIDIIQLFLVDNIGLTPLEYVPLKQTTKWIAFLDNHKEEMFPINGPPLAVTRRGQLQLPDPPDSISIDLARLISSGRVPAEQLAQLRELRSAFTTLQSTTNQ
jgi:hypothetical protein